MKEINDLERIYDLLCEHDRATQVRMLWWLTERLADDNTRSKPDQETK